MKTQYLFVILALVVACGDDDGNENSFNNITDVSFPDMPEDDMGTEDMDVPDLAGSGLFVEPAYTVMRVGQLQQLTAIGVGIDTVVVPDPPVVWAVSDTSVVTIDENALVTAVGAGEAAVTGTWDEFLGFAAFRVVGSTAQLSTGDEHTCSITNDGSAVCWGDNTGGQLGIGENAADFVAAPSVVESDRTFVRIAAAKRHSCALDDEGKAFCWGQNTSGQLGNGGFVDSEVPVAVTGDRVFAEIFAGGDFTCALAPDLLAWCWGANGSGQLGLGTTGGSESEPMAVTGGLSWTSLSPGAEHVCGISSDRVLHCWGDNTVSQLGEISGASMVAEPQPWDNFRIGSVRSGQDHVCGLAASTVCWGSSEGLGSAAGESSVPVEVQSTERFQGVFPGGDHTCAYNGQTQVSCWGNNAIGQLGDTTTTSRVDPAPVLGMAPLTLLDAGLAHTCGISSNGDVFCWGANGRGQIGDGTTTDRRQPTYASPIPEL